MDKIKFYLPILSFFGLGLLNSYIQSETMNFITLDLGISSNYVNRFNLFFLSIASIPFIYWSYRNSKHIKTKYIKNLYLVTFILCIFLISYYWITYTVWK